jgi:hypothetical protein
MFEKLSVLIISCDRYSDIWEPFFSLLWRYWPDCPYPIILGANKKIFEDERIKMINTGEDHSWADSTRYMVKNVPTEYILVLLEDFLFMEKVDNYFIEKNLKALVGLDGGYLRLKPFPKPDKPVMGFEWIGEIERDAPYRVSLQASIWRKDVLLSLLVNGESAWDFELKGTHRSNAIKEGFYCTWKPVLIYRAGVTMGKWVPFAVRICQDEGIPIDFSKRSVMTHGQDRQRSRGIFVSNLINNIPWQYRRRLGNLLRRLKLLPQRTDV